MYTTKRLNVERPKSFLVAFLGVLLLIAGFISATVAASAAEAATLRQVLAFGSNPGNLRMYIYIPDAAPANMPLVVALHGCTQAASSYDDASGWTKMADTYKFALVFPEQQIANNPLACFNWFKPGDTTRDSGETLSIKQMVDRAKGESSIDTKRVYVTGVSAGGFMTSNLLAAYPDVFAGGGIVAGGPAGCASDSVSALLCMNPGIIKSPQQWGDLARGMYPSWRGPWPKVSIWHGGADRTVNVMNLTESMDQWTNVHGADQMPNVQDTVRGYPHRVYYDSSGEPVVETYNLTGQPHGQPIDPGSGTEQCGVAGGAGMTDMNICAAYYLARFFGLAG
ncbi:extracellular catalytic domain type 1 short-chain-length polyhydroxyalkanoate depolymerase [Fodinicola acaciae]|uniref:extracellular catalytic domain type 1 short-chain-length polyhydroxyalkanoate depolymerase n=1 Tax=Fodinicola acaciae TaxID=2681555 RepID=UPI001C9E3FA1|nr:PHB depolymerase family esterase [Fodinicola acaciae]